MVYIFLQNQVPVINYHGRCKYKQICVFLEYMKKALVQIIKNLKKNCNYMNLSKVFPRKKKYFHIYI